MLPENFVVFCLPAQVTYTVALLRDDIPNLTWHGDGLLVTDYTYSAFALIVTGSVLEWVGANDFAALRDHITKYSTVYYTSFTVDEYRTARRKGDKMAEQRKYVVVRKDVNGCLTIIDTCRYDDDEIAAQKYALAQAGCSANSNITYMVYALVGRAVHLEPMWVETK